MSRHQDALPSLSSETSDLEAGVVDEEAFVCKLTGNQEESLIRRAYVSHTDYIMEPLCYRPIMPKDRDRIQELHEEWFPVAYQEDFYDNLVLGKMCRTNDPLYTNLLCDEDDEIKACLVGMSVKGSILNLASRQLLLPEWPHRHERVFYIMTLGTVTEFRHKGLASDMIAELVEQVVADDRKCGAMYLHVITTNQAAIRFYERLKFWRVQEIASKTVGCIGE